MSIANSTLRILAIACAGLLLAACGEDGETTASIAGGDNGGGGNGGVTAGNHGRVQFSAPAFEVNEAAGSATITITRTDGSDGAVSIRVTSRDGSATAADYTAVAATVTFNDGDAATKTVSVPIIDDATDEPDETLYLTLATPTGGVSLGSASETLLTVLDDDVSAPSAPKAALSAVYKELQVDWTAVTGATSYRLLKDPTGGGNYTQIGDDLPATQRSVAVQVVVHKENWLNARYVVAACNAAGCTQSNAVSAASNSAALVGYLKASNTGDSDTFGSGVALSADGNTLAVAARFEDSGATGIGGNQVSDCAAAIPVNCSYGSGAVFVYVRNGSSWSAPVYIKADNIGTDNISDNFGTAIALSADGNTLAVGAPYEDSSTTGVGSTANESAFYSGAVYVYARSGAAWMGPVYVKASNPEQNDYFGVAVALSADGNTLAVGADGEDSSTTGINSAPDNSALSAGAAYVYTRTGGTWSNTPVYVKASNTGDSDAFGSAIALSADGNTLAVSAPFEDTAATGIGGNPVSDCGSGLAANCATSSGAVYVYSRSGAVWSGTPVYVKASNTSDYDYFGQSLALSGDGNTLAVGAPNESSAATGINGNQVNDCASAATNCSYYSGAAYLYSRSGSGWSAPTYVKAANTGQDDAFGSSVALSSDGNTFVAGAEYEDGSAAGVAGADDDAAGSSGAAYVYSRTASTWSAPTYVKASNSEGGDAFGSSAALSADGATLAVGAFNEQSAATGLNANQQDDCEATPAANCADRSGAVYIY